MPRDLETISLKCLEKEPAQALFERRRAGRRPGPVRPASRSWRGRRRPLTAGMKLARRHRAVVSGVAGVMAALALGHGDGRHGRARVAGAAAGRRATPTARRNRRGCRGLLRRPTRHGWPRPFPAPSGHDIREAARQLERPRELRGWEWRHLHARGSIRASPSWRGCRTSKMPHSAPRASGSPSPTGGSIAWSTPSAGGHSPFIATDRPCRQVLAFLTDRACECSSTTARKRPPSFRLTDGSGAALAGPCSRSTGPSR